MTADDDEPGPRAGPLPPPEPPRLPSERLLRRRAPMSGTAAASAYPGGLLVRRLDTALALRGNAPAGALWRDPDGRWRATPGAPAARAVCGERLDEDALEGRAPSFRRFAEAREWLLAALGGDQGGGGDGGGPGRRGGRRGQVIALAGRRAGPRRR